MSNLLKLVGLSLLLCSASFGMAQQSVTALPETPTPTAEVLLAFGGAQSSSAPIPMQNATPRPPVDPDQVTANGDQVPLSRQQPKRILGLMPNYRTVSAGAVPKPPSAKTNFMVATRQAFDYSSFVFLGITSLSAEGLDEHPKLGKGIRGFYAYTWRGFLDKTDGNYVGGFFLPTILHEDTRYYAMGLGNPWKRVGYATSRTLVTRTYHQQSTFNFSNIGSKFAAQAISKNYYPAGTTPFSILAEKFGYSVARDIGFTVFREFYPDIATHYLRRKKP